MDEFRKTDFVILDVETTGLSPAYGDRVIEVAALKVKDLKVVDRFSSLLDPERPLSYGAFLVNGITPEMLEGAPTAKEILPEFIKFCDRSCLVGHNLRFDLSFLQHEAIRCDCEWPRNPQALDTLRLAKWLLPELRYRRLQAVAQALAIESEQQHRALADVETTFAVFRQFLEMAFRRDVCSLKDLFRYGGLKTAEPQEKKRRSFFPPGVKKFEE